VAVEKRRGRALEAAVSVVEAVGVVARHPAILADSNNTIVWLAPASIVAKVGTSMHDALAAFPGLLPPFDLELAGARRLLLPVRSSTLEDSDRRFLVSVVDEPEETLAGRVTAARPLHGSPHPGNWLRTTEGLALLDFVTACRGR
jgi:hypothetical protein